MRRALLAALIAVAAAAPAVIALAAAAAPAGAAAPTPTAPAKASLEGFVCQRPSDTLNRVIAVVAVMRSMPSTQRMQMRFVLQRRDAGQVAFTPVQGGDLGHWLDPRPPTLGQHPNDVWRLRKLVANLPGPATYRFRITFRWVGSSATVLARTSLLSATCTEPR